MKRLFGRKTLYVIFFRFIQTTKNAKMSNPRLNWISQRIFETFEPAVSKDTVDEFLKETAVAQNFQEFLVGKDVCKVFVHFQDENYGVGILSIGRKN